MIPSTAWNTSWTSLRGNLHKRCSVAEKVNMDLTIHRGTHEIGGTCVELTAGNTRLILDLGMPLVWQRQGRHEPFDFALHRDCPGPELVERGVLPAVKGLYAWETPAVEAVLVSHAHQDHYGFSHFIHPDIPVYASQETIEVMRVSALFVPNATLPARLEALRGSWKPQSFGDFVVKAHPVDHSSRGGVALEVTAKGKSLFYSGDLRAHGRNRSLFGNMLANPPENVDALLLEGSMMSRPGPQRYESEHAVEEALTTLFGTQKDLALFFCSGQNVDRLLSVHQAVRNLEKERPDLTLVMDLYTAFVLLRLGQTRYPPPLQMSSPQVRVMHWRNHKRVLVDSGNAGVVRKAKRYRIELDDALAPGNPCVFLARNSSLFDRVADRIDVGRNVEVIWSQWEGYLDGQTRVEAFCQKHGFDLHKIHTSGHATVEDLVRLVQAVAPKTVIPVHTFTPESYPKSFPDVTLLRDGEPFSL